MKLIVDKETFDTLDYIILVGATLITAILLTIILRKLLSIFIKKYAKRLKTDPTNFSFMKNAVGFFVITAAFIFPDYGTSVI